MVPDAETFPYTETLANPPVFTVEETPPAATATSFHALPVVPTTGKLVTPTVPIASVPANNNGTVYNQGQNVVGGGSD